MSLYLEIGITLAFAILGFISGWVARGQTKNVDEFKIRASELLAWVFSLAWLFLHGYGLLTGKFNIPWAFDIVGAITIGHVLGFDVKEVINAIRKK